MKILITESHLKKIKKCIISEVAWETDKVKKIKEGQIPLTPTVVKMLLGEPRKITSFHITDEKNIDNIRKIIGKRSSISVFKYFSEYSLTNMSGVQTNGGVIMKVEGILDFIASRDIFSTVDFSLTRRWINSSLLSNSLHHNLILATMGLDLNTNEGLKEYMKILYKLIESKKSEIKQNFFLKKILSDGENFGDWNELLVRNIRVKEVVWKPSRVYGFCKTDQREQCKNLIQEFSRKLRSLSPERVIEIGDDEDDKLINWYKENGGYTNKTDFFNNVENYAPEIVKNSLYYFVKKLNNTSDINEFRNIIDEILKLNFSSEWIKYIIKNVQNKKAVFTLLMSNEKVVQNVILDDLYSMYNELKLGSNTFVSMLFENKTFLSNINMEDFYRFVNSFNNIDDRLLYDISRYIVNDPNLIKQLSIITLEKIFYVMENYFYENEKNINNLTELKENLSKVFLQNIEFIKNKLSKQLILRLIDTSKNRQKTANDIYNHIKSLSDIDPNILEILTIFMKK